MSARRVIGALIGVGWLMSAAASAIADEMPGAPLVESLLERLESGGGLRAPFVQINHWVMTPEPDTSRGVLSVAPPHRFRLDYQEPAGHCVGCDGRQVWTFVPEERQVLRAQLGGTTGWGDFFLEGLREAADSAAVVRVVGGKRRAVLTLGARPAWGVQELVLELDVDTREPVAYEYTDEEGNRFRFEFTDVSYPSEWPPAAFRFEAPDGYEILDVD